MGSFRLPGKVLRPLCGKPMLWHIVERVRAVPRCEQVVVATSQSTGDDAIEEVCSGAEIPCFRGSEQDVLDRFYRAAREFEADPVIRVTGDCPLIDPGVINAVIEMFEAGSYDHVGVATGAGAIFQDGGRFPDGLDAECTSFGALETAFREATAAADREHVTPFIWQRGERFRLGVYKADRDYSMLRWTVDDADDFATIAEIYVALYEEGAIFGMEDVLRLLEAPPDLVTRNQHSIGTEGYREVWSPEPGGGR